MCKIIYFVLCIFSIFSILYFGQSNKVEKSLNVSPDTHPSLQTVAPFKIGVSVDPFLLKEDKRYTAVVLNEFNSLTPENYMKMNRLVKEEGIYDWGKADELVRFGIENNKRIHGHTLVWHNALPEWVKNFKGDKNEWDKLMKMHIFKVVGHFKGRVTSWDVVNEAFEEDGSYRESIWFKNIGKEYIEKAFRYAHEADPNALLFYNDFHQEKSAAKSQAILEMLLKLKEAKVPVHGIGLQMHTSIFLKNRKMKDAFESMSKSGLMVHISELTVTVNPHKSDLMFVQDSVSMLKQMNKIAEIITEYKHIVPNKQQYGITFWNVGDKDSYIPRHCKCKEYPQIFDENYNRKAYFSNIITALDK